jgi:hypothetical protein
MKHVKVLIASVTAIILLTVVSCGVVVNPLQTEDVINMEEGAVTSARNAGGDEIIMQGFDWNSRYAGGGWYNYLASQAGWLNWLGVTMVWQAPPWQDWSPDGKGYLPRTFSKNSNYGNDWEFHNVINTLGNAGIASIVDIVANHRDPAGWWEYGDGWRRDCSYGDWNCRKWNWWAWNWGADFTSGDADVNIWNAWWDYANEMKGMKDYNGNIKGWRYDFARGFQSEAMKNWNNHTGAEFAVMEVWYDDCLSGDCLAGYAGNGDSTIMDFALKKQFNTGNLSNFRWGMNSEDTWRRSRAVTFVDNHDTGCNSGQCHWGIPSGIRYEAYSFICIAPGTPCLYWADIQSDGNLANVVQRTVALRKEAGIKAWSAISWWNDREATIYGDNKQVYINIDGWNHPSGWHDRSPGYGSRVRMWLQP